MSVAGTATALMMRLGLSPDDRRFRTDFEAGAVAPQQFDHRGHVRLAYIYLTEHDPEAALTQLRAALVGFLAHHGISPSKYHETMTHAWILAVHHFMKNSAAASSADEFIEMNPLLLDSRIMMTHYSAELLFSDGARQEFMAPDLDPIPRHDS